MFFAFVKTKNDFPLRTLRLDRNQNSFFRTLAFLKNNSKWQFQNLLTLLNGLTKTVNY